MEFLNIFAKACFLLLFITWCWLLRYTVLLAWHLIKCPVKSSELFYWFTLIRCHFFCNLLSSGVPRVCSGLFSMLFLPKWSDLGEVGFVTGTQCFWYTSIQFVVTDRMIVFWPTTRVCVVLLLACLLTLWTVSGTACPEEDGPSIEYAGPSHHQWPTQLSMQIPQSLHSAGLW